MDVNALLKLIDAGFTKEDIMKISAVSMPKEVTNSEPEKVEPAPEPEKAPEVKEEKAPAIEDAITKALKPFEQLYNNMAKLAGMPAMENVEPKGIDDILDSFFKGD